MKINKSNIQMKKLLQFAALIILGFSNPLIAKQQVFASPEDASNSLYSAIEQQDGEAINILFGKNNDHLLPIADVYEKDRLEFLHNWKHSHKLIGLTEDQLYIEVGTQGWLFPIPIVKTSNGWHFDTEEGGGNIRIRYIGHNELSTMRTVQAFHDAQFEYAYQDRNKNSTFEFAQKFTSSPGERDGLYWEVVPGKKISPLGLIYDQNYPNKAYHGYYYKILTAQGSDAHGGTFNYLNGDRMTSGFALIAWPADYDNSGISSFMINQYGVMYEKNLGPETARFAPTVESFNPDKGWLTVNDRTELE